MLDRIVIVGAGRTAESVLERLSMMAPIVVLDTVGETLEAIQPLAETEDSSAPRFSIAKRVGDGTSRFVLEEARGNPREVVGIVAATPDDRKNIEIAKIAQELGFQPILGIVLDPKMAEAYEAVGARPIIRATILGQVVESALRYDGLVIATTVGQGKGEILEFTVLPGSPAIGIPLSSLRADGWRIAAIYRNGNLVLPLGATCLQAEDRVVLVGDPVVLPGVAAQLRIGVPMFPMPYGKRVVVYLPQGRTRALESEAEVLAIKTRATTLVRAYPGATADRTVMEDDSETPDLAPHQRSKIFEDVALEGQTLLSHLDHLRRLRPGLLVAPRFQRTVWERLLGRGGPAAAVCNAVRAPVLFPRGNPRFARVVHAIIQGIADPTLADAAIDLARMLSLPFVVVRVDLPAFFGEKDDAADQVATLVQTRTQLYGVRADSITLTGNPVKELIAVAKPTDLMVLGRSYSTRDSFTSPDIALRVAASAACSVLVKTVGGP